MSIKNFLQRLISCFITRLLLQVPNICQLEVERCLNNLDSTCSCKDRVQTINLSTYLKAISLLCNSLQLLKKDSTFYMYLFSARALLLIWFIGFEFQDASVVLLASRA